MAEIPRHLRLAVRSLLRRPTFCFLVVLTLGLGTGASAAILSVVNGVLLRPPPYRDPGRLALIWSRWSNFDKTWLSSAEYADYQRQDRLFEEVAAWAENGELAITGNGQPPESVVWTQMTANTLSVLGVRPALGRTFSSVEDKPNGPNVALAGYDLWRRRWGGDSGIVGRSIELDGEPFEIVGVLPRDFRFPLEFRNRNIAQIVLPLGLDPGASNRGGHFLHGVARLRPEVNAAMATTGLQELARGWTKQGLYPEEMRFTAFSVPVLDEISGNARPALAVLSAAVAFLLLLTLANVASLILIRADSRHREIAVRTALGGGMRDLLRLALTEGLLLALAGGFLGLALAGSGVRVLLANAGSTFPRASEIAVDGRVVAFTAVVALACGLFCGLIPLARASRLNVTEALRDGRGRRDGAARRRTRGALIVVESALAVLLLVGAGLTLRSFVNLNRIDAGFDDRHALSVRVSLPRSRYGSVERADGFFRTFGDRVRHLPGVEAAGFVRLLPLATTMGDSWLSIEGKPTPPRTPGRSADWQAVSPGYFEAMKIRLVRGRFFSEADSPDGEQVIAVNETLAREYFPGEDPIGRRIQLGSPEMPWRTVVAVVGDVLHNGLLASPKRGFYVPQAQWSRTYRAPLRSVTLVVRSAVDPDALLPPLRRIVQDLDVDLPLTAVTTLSQVRAAAEEEQRFTASVLSALAALALVLAAIGIYGIISYAVSLRTLEIGIRMALGANAGSVRGLVLRQGLAPALGGTLAGLAAAWALTVRLRSLLYGVAPLDPFTYTLIPLVLLAVAFASVLVPAVRASRVDPVEALRAE